jgi:hypothetical protein
MKNNDNGMQELLELLKSHPQLIHALVFDPASIKRLLKSKAARRLLIGVDTKAFLRAVAGPAGPIALCVSRSRVLAGRTRCPSRSRCPATRPTIC